MKILIVSDEECAALWDYYTPGRLRAYDLILSCGDLKAEYLRFLVTMARCPVLYVHGNHDGDYDVNPPEGCDCIDGALVEYNGVRILGLGGCRKYRPGPHQYTERQMTRRIRRLGWYLWLSDGVDIIVTHAPAEGAGDAEGMAHRGFACLRTLVEAFLPDYLFHGHVHLRYGAGQREHRIGPTRVINACQRYELEIPDRPFPEKNRGKLIWRTPHKE